MFTELLPLLAKRSFILTTGLLKDGRIRVTVNPKPTGKDDPTALSFPYQLDGTPEDLDVDLPKGLAGYVANFVTLEAGLAEVKSNMDAALAEAKKEADKKVAEAKAKNKPTGKAAPTKAVLPEPPKADALPGLFDAPTATPTSVEVPAAPATDDDGDDDDDTSDESDVDDVDSDSDTASNVLPTGTPTSGATVSAHTTNNLFSIEEEILEEAFHGTQDNLVAA
jgi:PRTRC genetic system protein E